MAFLSLDNKVDSHGGVELIGKIVWWLWIDFSCSFFNMLQSFSTREGLARICHNILNYLLKGRSRREHMTVDDYLKKVIAKHKGQTGPNSEPYKAAAEIVP
ncbi:hypothetical protein [Paenibacillus sp. Soil766]|uniref:hypothetical protein n=1 Tax=Paenibacillus sp. Soil766 TaxID=1736404 RepID=UPI0012F908FA|nr:hypothetical protein [Paenibacillus sp. Soil766]